jgi:hypothetical protein
MPTRSSTTPRRTTLHTTWMFPLTTLTAAIWFAGPLVEPARGQCAPVWSAVGTEHDYPAPVVRALAVFDDGTGPALYAGGEFDRIGRVSARNLAMWDGQTWSEVAGGVSGPLGTQVDCLRVLDLGDGPALYAGGDFVYAGDVRANGITRWDGSAWSALGAGFEQDPHSGWLRVYDMRVFDDGAGPRLYVGGYFEAPHANFGLAAWDGIAWNPVGANFTAFFPPGVGALAVRAADPSTLIVGGTFDEAGGVDVENVARWNGGAWTAMGSLPVLTYCGFYLPTIGALTEHDDGSGPALIAGGAFGAGEPALNCFARWDGSAWTLPAAFHIAGSTSFTIVAALQAFDDGSGPDLYGAGSFTTITPDGGSEGVFNHVFRWDGTAFSPVGTGVGGGVDYEDARELVVFDDGRGPALYVGGYFESAGDVPARGIARWGCVLGDLNCDGRVNNFDITPFVKALTDPTLYHELYPNCSVANGDLNADGQVNNFDITPFVHLLTCQ